MKNNVKIAIAAGIGAAAGVLAGILFAPQKGADTRNLINEQGKKISDIVKSTLDKTVQALTCTDGVTKKDEVDTNV